MKIDVTLPDLGEDAVDKVTISSWLAEVGDSLAEGDDLIELTTDKAAFSLPAPQAGVLAEQKVRIGDEVNVGDVLCVFDV